MQEASEPAGDIKAQTKQILLIDDDPFALKLLARQLEKLGHQALAMCEKAYEAVQYLQTDLEAIRMIFCDLRMPDFDGIEFIRHLDQIKYRGGLILVTGEDDRIRQTAEKLAKAYNIDLYGTLVKPVKPADLQRILARGAAKEVEYRRHREPLALGANDLRDAIRNGHLVNFYQPKVNLLMGELVGVEALVRWRHERFGLVFPDQFIHIAEENGLIEDLTWSVMKAAFRDCKVWSEQGQSLKVAINVSMTSFASIDFPERVTRMADDAGIPLSSVILEVTESQLMNDLRNTLDVFTRLRLMRVGLAIDDFGTGNSSLVQLREVPFNELKMDRSFVHGASTNPSLRSILDGTLTMARGLGMTSVAEGVEDIVDWGLVRDLGCTMAQGYFIARPMIAQDILKWRTHREQRLEAQIET